MEHLHKSWSPVHQDAILQEYHILRQKGFTQREAVTKAQNVIPAGNRISAHSNLVWRLNKVYKEDERFKTNGSASPATNGHTHGDEYTTPARESGWRIKWTGPELTAISAQWIELRLADPFKDSAVVLLEKAQRKVLAGERQRDINSFLANPGIVAEVTRQWLALLGRLESVPATPPAPPEPETKIIYCEIPRKWTFEEMLVQMSEPELTALLTAKKIARETRRDELLYENAIRAGATNLVKVPAFTAKLDAFAAPRTHGPRIAIIGLNAGFQVAVESDVKAAGLDTKLSFPQGQDHTTVARCDFAIVCRGKLAASNSDGDSVIGQLTRNRVALLADPNVADIMQEIRNFCSRK